LNADPAETTVSVGVLSLLSVPAWALIMPMHWPMPPRAIVLQAFYQGVIVGVVALFLYARVVILIGPVQAALFLPVVPCVVAIGGWFVLGERPSEMGTVGDVHCHGGNGRDHPAHELILLRQEFQRRASPRSTTEQHAHLRGL
jgi:hypothetical protein